jgi:O-acetylserine/cysteine efflux transporter
MTPREILTTIGIMMLWGGNLAVAKPALEQMPPVLVMALRFALIAVLLLPFARLPRGQIRPIALLSFTMGTLHFGLMFTALKELDAAVAAIVTQVQVPFAVLLAWAVFGDRPRWRRLTGIAVAFGGIALIAGEPQAALAALPLLITVAASFMWAVVNIQVKLIEGVDGVSLNAWMALFAIPQLLAVSLALESGHLPALLAADWLAWFAVAYAAIAVTVIGYVLWYRLLARHSVSLLMPFTLLVPVFGVLAGVLLRGEAFGWQRAAGAIVTLIGVAIIVLRRPETAAPAAIDKTS